MYILFIILFILSIIHFVYQRIILPSYRQNLRTELFIIRDELRKELIKNKNNYNKTTIRAFREVDESINKATNRLHWLTLTRLINLLKTDLSTEDIKRKNKLHNLMEASQSQLPLELYNRSSLILCKALIINSFMLIMYAMPLLIPYMIIRALLKALNKIKDGALNKIKEQALYMAESCLIIKRQDFPMNHSCC